MLKAYAIEGILPLLQLVKNNRLYTHIIRKMRFFHFMGDKKQGAF